MINHLKPYKKEQFGVMLYGDMPTKHYYIVQLPIDNMIDWPKSCQLLPEVEAWLNENCIDEWTMGIVVSGISGSVWFESSEDAMVFYLRWQ